MPIDFTSLRQQIDSYAEAYRQARDDRAMRLAQLATPLDKGFTQVEALLEVCRKAHCLHWPVALFDSELINQQFPFDKEPDCYALIASDGSQILPDRHKPFTFAYIQAGCAGIVYGNPAQRLLSEQWRQLKRVKLIEERALFDEDTGELKPPAEVINQRDLMEIELLAEACRMAHDAGLQPVLVADGSLVPFALLTSRNLAREVEALLQPLKAALDVMHDCGAWACGYIDRPNSKSIVRACALAGLSLEQVTERALRERDPAGVFDRHLLERTLSSAHRTALFDPGWQVNAPEYLGKHAMRACYVNFGEPDQPIIARIEVPQWCARQIGSLCAVLHRHVRLGGGYPFILTAAHTESVVSKDDQQEIEQAIEQTLLAQGILPRPSFKQEAKDRA